MKFLSKKQRFSMNDLANELLLIIFENLNYSDLVIYRRVSKNWRSLIDLNYFQKEEKLEKIKFLYYRRVYDSQLEILRKIIYCFDRRIKKCLHEENCENTFPEDCQSAPQNYRFEMSTNYYICGDVNQEIVIIENGLLFYWLHLKVKGSDERIEIKIKRNQISILKFLKRLYQTINKQKV